ncbi:MAG: hypothetical protein HKN23_08550 [Verrucomicrobiales bacterium]|nr:hypothetical protein [Verrucomicrobiales bacterium]
MHGRIFCGSAEKSRSELCGKPNPGKVEQVMKRPGPAFAAFVVLALITGGCWQRSYTAAEGLRPKIGGRELGIANYNGNLVFWVYSVSLMPPPNPRIWQPEPGIFYRYYNDFSDGEHRGTPIQPFGKFMWYPTGTYSNAGWSVAIPHWTVVTMLVLIAVATCFRKSSKEG